MYPSELNARRAARLCLYMTMRRHGVPLELRQASSSSVNLDTGEVTEIVVTTPVRRAIAADPATWRKAEWTKTSGAAALFDKGGRFTQKTKLFLIDKRDVPAIRLRDAIVYSGVKYEVKEFVAEDDFLYRILAEAT